MVNFYCQHVGEKMAKRDFPKSLGTITGGFTAFRKAELLLWPDFEKQLGNQEVAFRHQDEPQDGWQVWGFPSGAHQAVSKMAAGDFLMLKGAESECEFVGEISFRLDRIAHEFSKRIWGEINFPIIVLLRNCHFLDLTWEEFCRKVGYSDNYTLQGRTSRVTEKRMTQAGVSGARELFNWCVLHTNKG